MRRIVFSFLIVASLASFIASVPLAAHSQGESMLQYTQVMSAVLPDGNTSTPYAITITKSAQRERFDDPFGTTVFECDSQRSLHWKLQDKTYTAKSFQDMSREHGALEAAFKASGQSESSAAVRDAPDAKTAVIDGITADHLVETLTSPASESFGPRVDRDIWYVPGGDPFRCPALEGIYGKSTGVTSSHGSSSGSAFVSLGTLQQANVPPNSLVLRESDSLSAMGVVVRIEVAAIKTLPYDPSYFDPPVEFAQVSPPPFVMPTFRPAPAWSPWPFRSPQAAIAIPTATTAAQRYKLSGTDMSVTVPSGVKIAARKNLPDFDVYDFSLGGHHLLSAYVGRDPDFHMFSYHPTAKVERRIVGALNIADITYRTTRWGATREVLVSEKHAGVFIHFFYESVPIEMVGEADRIIASVSSVVPQKAEAPAPVFTRARPTPTPTPTPALIPVGDTILDANGDYIAASIVGCAVRNTDRVLVNGLPEDGVNWDRLSIDTQRTIPLSSAELKLARAASATPAIVRPIVAFRLKPGYYNFTLSVGDCSSAPFPLIALDGYGDRHITVWLSNSNAQTPSRNYVETETAGLVGSVPIDDLQVTLTGRDVSQVYVARVESYDNFLGNHYMYFFDGVSPGQYTLTVSGLGWKRALGAADLTMPGKVVHKDIPSTDTGP